ncbi:MAG: hypothetical protein N2505_05165 [Endomicrobia bacterium]|nr:hypothetical protein [Endomicrobiia bacterium]
MVIKKKGYYILFFFIIVFCICYAEINFGIISGVKNTIKKIKKSSPSTSQNQKANTPPVILQLKIEEFPVFVDKEVGISCVAYDEDNDVLTYSWSCSSGTVTSVSIDGSVIIWNTPLTSGTYTVSCNVSDGRGGVAISSLEVLVKYNHAPVLSWTYEEGYENDGVEPDEGPLTTTFKFRIKYTDKDGDPPMVGYPILHVEQAGKKIKWSPLGMNYSHGDPIDGSVYFRDISFYDYLLLPATDYSYYFEVRDQYGAYGFTPEISGPYVSGHWEVKEVDTGEISGETSIVLDSFGNPHICYFDFENSLLKYAHFKDTWSVSTIDAGYVYCSMTVDSSDTLHISYYNNGKLNYAKKLNNSWHIQTVTTETAYYNSIAVDSSGGVHISYYNLATQDLKYAKYDGVSWSTYTVESYPLSNERVGLYTSIVVDSSDNVHISYCYANDLTQSYILKYAKWDGISWSTSALTTQEEAVLGETSIAVSSSNKVYIVYFDSKNGDLNCVNWVEVGSFKGWRKERIEKVAECRDVSLEISSDGRPCVSYLTREGLKYAKITSYGWLIQTIESSESLIYGNVALAVDKLGLPHISYTDIQKNSLKYAVWRP